MMAYKIQHTKSGMLTVTGIVSLFGESETVISNAEVFNTEAAALMTGFCLRGEWKRCLGWCRLFFYPSSWPQPQFGCHQFQHQVASSSFFAQSWRMTCAHAAAGTDPAWIVICF